MENMITEKECSCNPCKCNDNKRSQIEVLVEKWYNMKPSEMRLRAGEMTAQEIRTVRAVLRSILSQGKTEKETDNSDNSDTLKCCMCQRTDGVIETTSSGTNIHRKCLEDAGLCNLIEDVMLMEDSGKDDI